MIRKSYAFPDIPRIVLVGVGGTGSFLAQSLAKIISGYRLTTKVLLCDPQIIEEKNIYRQNFKPWEVGQPKASALAFRLNQEYGTTFTAHDGTYTKIGHELIITCVDTVEGRRPFQNAPFWLDLGNGLDTGQAIFGTTSTKKDLTRETKNWDKTPLVQNLPNSYRLNSLGKIKSTPNVPSCADSPFTEQGALANEAAAHAGMMILHQLLVKGTVTTPAIYFNTSTGRMTPEAITKEYLSR